MAVAQYVGVLLKTIFETTVDDIDAPDPAIFSSIKLPDIPIQTYVNRLIKYIPDCHTDTMVHALILMDRFGDRQRLYRKNIHRVALIAFVIAHKYSSDDIFNNYHRVGGVSLREFVQLEVSFLYFIEFSVYYTLEEFEKYTGHFPSAIKKHIIIKR